jgi:acyl-CoA synthetase (AMP-forming)/AMP-acid ligase II
MIACLVGCLRAGRDFVSLPLPGRGQDALAYSHQLQKIIELTDTVALIVEDAYAEQFRTLPSPLPCPLRVAERVVESAATGLSGDPEPGELIQFSSGTTGTPKGVRLSGRALAACTRANIEALRIGQTRDVFCSWVPLSHDMGLIGGLLTTWVGSSQAAFYGYVCISPELFVARPSIWMASCAAQRATVTAAPTFAYHVVARLLGKGPAFDLTSLRGAVIGAEPIGPATLRAFAGAASRHGLREVALCPAYGLAEATLTVSMVLPEEPWATRVVSVDGQKGDYVVCGRVLDCIDVTAPKATTDAGPIKIKGASVCSGFIPARSASPDGWIDTGDLGILADGQVVVVGRSDDLLCIAGRNMFSWELEHAATMVSQVRAGGCAVVTDGAGRYVALFEPGSHAREDLGSTLLEVRRKLASVVGIGPSAVGCLPRGTLPKTPSGKIRRSRITADMGRFLSECLAYKEF